MGQKDRVAYSLVFPPIHHPTGDQFCSSLRTVQDLIMTARMAIQIPFPLFLSNFTFDKKTHNNICSMDYPVHSPSENSQVVSICADGWWVVCTITGINENFDICFGPHSSHVAGVLDPLIIIGEDVMNGDAPLIPIFRQNFRVHVDVEGVCYTLNIVRKGRTNLLLCRIDLETDNFCRYLDNSSYLTSRFNVKWEKNSVLIVEYVTGNGSVTQILYNAWLYIIRVRLCINHRNLAIFSDILHFSTRFP